MSTKDYVELLDPEDAEREARLLRGRPLSEEEQIESLVFEALVATFDLAEKARAYGWTKLSVEASKANEALRRAAARQGT